jgi:hypothetical protein
MTTKPALQKILIGIYTEKRKINTIRKIWERTNPIRQNIGKGEL